MLVIIVKINIRIKFKDLLSLIAKKSIGLSKKRWLRKNRPKQKRSIKVFKISI